ncbi:MAG: GHMP kinase [Bacteroidia bacterium]|nr:GHMP kinase [Bacteroidia bacterium]
MKFHSPGKLLLTSEYVVLAGAEALAVPTQFGQEMEVETTSNQGVIDWTSVDLQGNTWFTSRIRPEHPDQPKNPEERRLSLLLSHLFKYSNKLDLSKHGYSVTTRLEFDRDWGLGSSSSLVALLAKWGEIDGIKLLHAAFKGSGYDVAVGIESQALVYRLNQGMPGWTKTNWKPKFTDALFFVYLGQKQNSEKEVTQFQSSEVQSNEIEWFSWVTRSIMEATELSDFSNLITQHEERISKILNRPTIKSVRFADYPHSIKSLGAWGGDFVLVVGSDRDKDYFRSRGLHTILDWNEMILSS